MTFLGLAYYGGTLGLYDHPDGEEEWGRALAYLEDQEKQAEARRKRRKREED